MQEVTGRSIREWLLELIAEPLQLSTMINCMSTSGDTSTRCFRRSFKNGYLDMNREGADLLLSDRGPESALMTGTNIVASSSDVLRFLLTLFGANGKFRGRRVFSETTVSEMTAVHATLMHELSPEEQARRNADHQTTWDVPGTEAACQTFPAFQYGVGHNHTHNFYSWGSTYAHRPLLLIVCSHG